MNQDPAILTVALVFAARHRAMQVDSPVMFRIGSSLRFGLRAGHIFRIVLRVLRLFIDQSSVASQTCRPEPDSNHALRGEEVFRNASMKARLLFSDDSR